MIVEHALLTVREGQDAAFVAAIGEALALIAASPGFIGIEVRPSTDIAGRWLLRVEWVDIAAHRDDFRRSERYELWRTLLHGFYAPMPTVEYFGESVV